MKKTRKFPFALLVLIAVIIPIAWCGYNIFRIFTSPCDLDGYLTDPKIQEELAVALRDFERQHNVTFDHDLMTITSCTDAGMDVPLQYETPLSFSKYGISYNLSLSAIYSLKSKEVTLQISDHLSTTEDILSYIDSLKGAVAEFEGTPQMDEFANQFKQEGTRFRGTIYDELIWVESFTRREPLTPGYSLVGQLDYSTTTHSIRSYSLPNRITWRAFPEIPVIHAIVNEQLLVKELSNCVISTQKKEYATTDVSFTLGPSIRADVRIICGDTEQEQYVRLFVQPDGSYEAEVLIPQPDGTYESRVLK